MYNLLLQASGIDFVSPWHAILLIIIVAVIIIGIIAMSKKKNNQAIKQNNVVMKKNALTIIVGVLLLIYALTNFGASIGEFGKAKFVSGVSYVGQSMDHWSGHDADANRIREAGNQTSGILYLIAILILGTAVLDIVSAIGLFGGKEWTIKLLIITAICGIIIEFISINAHGFGIGKLIFLAINGLALYTVYDLKQSPNDQEIILENKDNFIFCSQCGKKQPSSSKGKFCNECGNQL